MTTTFCLRQYINFGLEFSVRSYRTWFTDNHTTTDIGFLNTTQQQTHVVTSFTVIHNLTEHFHPCYGRLQVLGTHSKDLNRITRVNHTTLDTASGYRTTSGDGEYVFDRHQERKVCQPRRNRDVRIYRVHQFHDLVYPLCFAVQTAQGRTTDDRDIVARIFVE